MNNTKYEIFASCSFSSLGLRPSLCKELDKKLGFQAPTVIQAQAIPVIFSGGHVLVNAETGTGKTVTYLAPIIHHLLMAPSKINRADGTFALIVVPTRELCTQVYETLRKVLHRFYWIVPGYLMGGEKREKEKARLRKGISILVATPGRLLDHLRHTSSFMYKNLQQEIFREDRLRREVEDLQKRYQASERRCEELISQVPKSTRPLLRQIEAMQENTSRRAEAWAAVERSLNSRLQEAESKYAAAEERERSVNERLSQTLSRVNVLEAQVSCLRAEQTQLTMSLEKERQRAAEIRQEYLAAKEVADTQEGRANQLGKEIKELRRKHKQELHEALTHRELLQQMEKRLRRY